jgi:hypothetical protein
VMRRWLRPNELAELGGWDLWRLREVGAWGDVARILGARWEEIGGGALMERFPGRVVPLWRDRALGRWLGTLGLPNPDAVLIDPNGEAPTLHPVDLKWAIDTATHTQVAAETFGKLIERAGERLRALLPGDPASWRLADGYFATPDRPLNRLYLNSRANREDERAIQPRDVMALPLDVAAFYAPLPGWTTALRLAGLEGVDDPAREVETADRYFHLGVGVRGALVAQERSLFDERPDTSDEALLRIDPAMERVVADRAEALSAEANGLGVRGIVRQLGRAQAERQVLRQRLRELERPTYRFGDFTRDARRARLGPPADPATRSAALRELYKDVSRAHAAALRDRGRALVAAGASTVEALDRLAADGAAMAELARERAQAGLRALRAKEKTGA